MSVESDKKPRRLGRGLSALVQASEPVSVESGAERPGPAGDDSGGIARLALADITPSPYQPRRTFDDAELEQLAQSIRQAGVIQPILVRVAEQNPISYELVAGERRWRAAGLAGLERVPAIIVSLSDHEAAEWALIENLQRKDLNPMERAHALRNLCSQFGLSHQQLADRVGLDRSTVANLIRVTDLADAIQELIAGGELSIGHGKALLAISNPDERLRLARRAAAERWTVRELERQDMPSVSREDGEPSSRVASPTLVDLERRLGEHLGTRVRITTSRDGSRGRLAMEFYSLDHFDGLMHKFGFHEQT